jgi:hypothetical protein
MDRPRIIRWLRIFAISACLVVSLICLVLWVRSYKTGDGFGLCISSTHVVSIVSKAGELYVVSFVGQPFFVPGHFFHSTDTSHKDRSLAKVNSLGFGVNRYQDGSDVVLPHWFPVVFSTALATLIAVPWLRWRFSIRTLLIVTTVVASALGLGVWLTQL